MLGCATTLPFEKLPQSLDAFQKTPEQIRQEYPEIQEYEKFRGVFFVNTPYVKELTVRWGEPQKIRKNWDYFSETGILLAGGLAINLFSPTAALIAAGIGVTINPFPSEHYFWIKGNYCIEAAIDGSIVGQYKKRVVRWKWHDILSGKEIPKECKILFAIQK